MNNINELKKLSGITDLLETGLNRIRGKIKSRATGVITAFRGKNTYAMNKQLNKDLLAYLLRKGYSVTKVKGSYIEQFGTPEAHEVGEESFFVASPINGDDGGALEVDLVKLGKFYDQDSILSQPYGGNPKLIGTSSRENSYPGLGNVDEKDKTAWGISDPGEFFSRVKDRTFVHLDKPKNPKDGEEHKDEKPSEYKVESIEEIFPPDTINGKHGMAIVARRVEENIKNL